MKIVKIDDVLRIYGDGIEIHEKVPVGTYSIQFSKMQGFFLCLTASTTERNFL